MPPPLPSFASRLVAWQRRHGRHDLPWQHGITPYRVWLSEIMLQQTQVGTVVAYFQRFVERFPDLPALARADEDEVLALWSGLGYYSRARNLLGAARRVMERHAGEMPASIEDLCALPGIGRSTAAAIVSLAHGRPAAILDGNVKRVLARHAGIRGWPGEKAVEAALWREAERHLPDGDSATYTQALMDLGATLCSRASPDCGACPVASDCTALRADCVAELPGRRPPRAKRVERVQMILLLDANDRLLLEKRPEHGVWARLWSLPELEPGADPARHCLARYGLAPGPARPLPAFRHAFTHYTLEVEPQLLRLDAAAPVTATAPGTGERRWLPGTEAAALGLPAPVRRLIERLNG